MRDNPFTITKPHEATRLFHRARSFHVPALPVGMLRPLRPSRRLDNSGRSESPSRSGTSSVRYPPLLVPGLSGVANSKSRRSTESSERSNPSRATIGGRAQNLTRTNPRDSRRRVSRAFKILSASSRRGRNIRPGTRRRARIERAAKWRQNASVRFVLELSLLRNLPIETPRTSIATLARGGGRGGCV